MIPLCPGEVADQRVILSSCLEDVTMAEAPCITTHSRQETGWEKDWHKTEYVWVLDWLDYTGNFKMSSFLFIYFWTGNRQFSPFSEIKW